MPGLNLHKHHVSIRSRGTPQDNYMSPLLSGDCVAIRHPGQVRLRREASPVEFPGGNPIPQGEPGSREKVIVILDFDWIPLRLRSGWSCRTTDLIRRRGARPE